MQSRTRARRRVDTERRLDAETDIWLATGSQHGGTPQLVPVPFLWYDGSVVLCAGASSLTARNLETTGYVRLALSDPRDVVLIDGVAETIRDVSTDLAEAFARKTSYEPRGEDVPELWFAIRPQRIQAWSDATEEADRTIFRDGAWLSEKP